MVSGYRALRYLLYERCCSESRLQSLERQCVLLLGLGRLERRRAVVWGGGGGLGWYLWVLVDVFIPFIIFETNPSFSIFIKGLPWRRIRRRRRCLVFGSQWWTIRLVGNHHCSWMGDWRYRYHTRASLWRIIQYAKRRKGLPCEIRCVPRGVVA